MPQEFAVMLDDKKLADMRRREMQHMINRFYHQKRIVSNFENIFSRFAFNFHYAAELEKVIKSRGLEEELALIEDGRQEVEEMRLLYEK